MTTWFQDIEKAHLPHGGMDVRMSRITSATSVSVDPFQPMLCTVTGNQILKIVCNGNVLRLGSTKEVLSDRVGIVAKGDLDWTLETMDISVVTSPLICFMLLHQR